MSRRFLSTVGAIVLATIFQAGIAPYIAIGGVVPDTLLLVAITLALIQGRRSGMVAGFAAGLIFDLMGTGPIGPAALVFCLVGYVAGSLQENTFAEGWVLPVVVLFIGSMLAELGYALALAVLGEGGVGIGVLIAVMVPGAVYNAALAVLFYPVLARFLRQDKPVTTFKRLSL